MKRIDLGEKYLAYAVRAAAIVLLVAILSIIALQIVSRSVFHNPVIWTEELARFSLIWLTLLGCSWLAFTSSHMGMGLDRRPNPGPGIRAWNTSIRIFSAVVVIFFAIAAFGDLSSVRGSSAALAVPTWIVYLSVPIGMTLWGAYEVLAIVRIAMGRPPENSTAEFDDAVLETE